MSTADATSPASTPSTPGRVRQSSPLYSALIGLAGLGVLLQGVWAGLFIREGQENVHQWVEVHARGAEVTIALAAIATVVALVRLTRRPAVWVGSIVFTALLVLESYIGGEVGDSAWLETIHFPLAMALLGLAVWLPLTARRGRLARR